ncbi:MAG: hypothetical protein IJ436_08445 [Bacteroidaceae bacterium]|nr:hypothetical protein [Bacteroidaceae bacterium]MBQ8543487.1 hypothetical protein [Bacteroidaceae bacterium]
MKQTFNNKWFYIIEEGDAFIRIATDKPVSQEWMVDFAREYREKYNEIYFLVKPFVERGMERAKFIGNELHDFETLEFIPL